MKVQRIIGILLVLLVVGGSVQAADAPTKKTDPSTDWPCWRGPNGGGQATDPGFKLVDDLSKAKLLWKSDQPVPPSNTTKKGVWNGGYSSPVVQNGRVYIFYCRVHGRESYELTARDLEILGTSDSYRLGARPAPWELWHADDVVHCFDANTGKTLWKFVDEHGLMNNGHKGEGHYTPCVDDGRVFALGTTTRLYCLDAKTGAKLWETYVIEANKDAFERSQTAGKSVFGGKGFNYVPCAIDGVVAIGSCTGYDAATGKKLWNVRTAGGTGRGASGIPIVWTHKGKHYFISGDTCIEPKTGKVLWQIPGVVNGTSPCVTEDLYICSGINEPGKKGSVSGSTCFRITPEKYEKIWSLPVGRSPTMSCGDVVCGKYFVQEADDRKSGGEVEENRTEGKEGSTGGGTGVTAWLVELDTGKVMAKTPSFRLFGFAPTSCQGMLFCGMYKINQFKVDSLDFRVVFPKGLPEGYSCSTSPALAGGRMYFRGDTRLVCYDLRNATAPSVSAEK